jgi:putative thioredoxin
VTAEQKLVHDVSDQDFAQDVLAASKTQPVVVDFWAPWCGPCRMLGPILERVVGAMEGRVVLAKVNVDENPRLSAQWRVRSIPAVKVFVNGEVVGEFVGAAPEAEVRRAIEAALPKPG